MGAIITLVNMSLSACHSYRIQAISTGMQQGGDVNLKKPQIFLAIISLL